jgi:hypothetical protein
MLAAGSLIVGGAYGALAATPSATSTVAGPEAWYTQAYENFDTGGYLTPQQSDVLGPQHAPFGSGSHQIRIGESSAQTELYRTNNYDDVSLTQISRLEYSTFARPTSGSADRQPTELRLSIDSDGSDLDESADTSLFFFPANNGPVVNGVWQHWNAGAGLWNEGGDSGPAGAVTLATYLGAHPYAELRNNRFDADHDGGAVALVTGGALGGSTDPQTNGDYYVDRVIVGENNVDVLYDFGLNTETQAGINKVVVSPGHLEGWAHQAYNDTAYLTPTQQFVTGPGTPPSGVGSLKFTLSDSGGADRVELFRTPQYDNTLLRDYRTLEFHTFQRPTAPNTIPQQPVYMRLSLDTNGDSVRDDTLFFFPANNGTVQQGVWQKWDADSGVWNVNSDTGPAGAISLEDYLVAHPDAKIDVNADSSPEGASQPKGGVAFLVGGGGAGQMDGEYFLDDITISKVDNATARAVSGTRFDLEPTQPPTGGGTGGVPTPTAPSIRIGDDWVSEGNHGARLRFPVTLSRATDRDITVAFRTVDGTALAGKDYRAKSGTVTVPKGSTSAFVDVTVISDKVRERKEQMTVVLGTPTYGTVTDASATGTIGNDDTRVTLGLKQATKHRVRAHVATHPAASGAPVKIFRITKSGSTLILSADLNDFGRLTKVLAHKYDSGATVKLVAVVRTVHGKYKSHKQIIVID